MQRPSPSWSCRAAAGDAAEEQPMRHRQPEGDGSARFRSMGRVDVLAACSTGRISCRQMALTLHWGVARDAVAERCASGRAAALQHLVAPKRLHSGRLYIVYNTGQAPRTYVRAMRECDTPRPVTFWREGAPLVYEFQLSLRESQWDVDVDWGLGVRERGCGHCGALESGGGRGTARVNDCRL